MAEEQAALKKKKYLYIMEHAAENGYDTSKFNNFLQQKFVCKLALLIPTSFLVLADLGQKVSIDDFPFERIVQLVEEYKSTNSQAANNRNTTALPSTGKLAPMALGGAKPSDTKNNFLAQLQQAAAKKNQDAKPV